MNIYISRECGPLVPQEQDVQRALASHYAPGSKGREDWVPVDVLWDRYRSWWLLHRSHWQQDFDYPGHYRRLTRRQFGHAVRRVYPGIRRKRRHVTSVRVYGYQGLRLL